MKYSLFPQLDERQKEQVLKILENCSSEFIPPLEYRRSPIQEDFTIEDATGSYFEEIMKHQFILALDQERVAGLLAFLHNPPLLSQPAIYISVICVHKTYRGQGIARDLYSTLLFTLPKYSHKDTFFVRTWSTNTIHQKLLSHLGFAIEKVIPNHRGNGIDTIYYKYQHNPADSCN